MKMSTENKNSYDEYVKEYIRIRSGTRTKRVFIYIATALMIISVTVQVLSLVIK
jgi:hypothetical protein